MRKLIPALLAIFAAGCIEREEDYTLNPDGSGKVVVRWTAAPFEFMSRGSDDPEESMKKAVRSQLSMARGVDCWKDVTYSLRDDGKVAFQGTAYFKDFNAVSLMGEEMRNPLGVRPSLEKDDKGNLVVTIQGGDEGAAELPAAEDVKKLMLKHRVKYQQARPMLRALLADYKSKFRITLPGPLDEVKGFAQTDRTVRLDMDGASIFKSLDDLYLVDENLKKAIGEGADLEFKQESLPGRARAALLGAREVRATTKGELKAAFEYDKELTAEVREKHEKLLESLPKDAMGAVMAAAAAEEGNSSEKMTVEQMLRDQVRVDLSAPTAMKTVKPGEQLDDLLTDSMTHGEGFGYDIQGPTFSSSSSGSMDRRLTMHFDDKGLDRLELRNGPDTTALRQSAGILRLTVENDTTGVSVMMKRGPDGVQIMILRSSDTFSKKWATFEEAARCNPAEVGVLMARLRAAPFKIAPTAADPEVMTAALAWSDRLDDATRKTFDDLRKRLTDESLEERNKATAELKKETGADIARLRYVVEMLEKAREEADVRARLQMAIDEHADLGAAIGFVRAKELHRDLPYLGALLAEPARASAARARLKALVGREFESRKDFDSWHEANKAGLKWNEETGTYK